MFFIILCSNEFYLRNKYYGLINYCINTWVGKFMMPGIMDKHLEVTSYPQKGKLDRDSRQQNKDDRKTQKKNINDNQIEGNRKIKKKQKLYLKTLG